jgi:hypothetical protein
MINSLFILTLFFLVSGADASANENYNFDEMENNFRSLILQHGVDTTNSVKCSLGYKSSDEKVRVYNQAVAKLKNINSWSSLIGIPGQSFKLYRDKILITNRGPQVGDLIKILLPGDPTARSYWVKIETIESNNNPVRFIKIVVRPSANPFLNRKKQDNITDHFFTNQATNTFSVNVYENHLVSKVSGQNEYANTTQVTNKWDAAYNNTIATMGRGIDMGEGRRVGFQSLVWSNFNKAIAVCD